MTRTKAGLIRNIEKTHQFVNHYSFHIMDPTFGHMTIKMSGHPPFGAQVILNGHEYVACAAQAAGIAFANEGNCFARVDDPQRLAQVTDTLSRTIAPLLTRREHVIAPILAGIRRRGIGRPHKTYTRIDRDYDNLRDGMRTLFRDLAVATAAA